MIHTFAKEYGYSKSQVDELYPEEAIVMLNFVAFEKRDEFLKKKLEYYQERIDLLNIEHCDPKEIRRALVKSIEALQSVKVTINKTNNSSNDDDELPDIQRLQRLKDFKREHGKG